MAEFEVTVSRSAWENVTLRVTAASQDDAEKMVNKLLDRPHRVDIYELLKVADIKQDRREFYADEESSWEIG